MQGTVFWDMHFDQHECKVQNLHKTNSTLYYGMRGVWPAIVGQDVQLRCDVC
jgi:hypothetical protein